MVGQIEIGVPSKLELSDFASRIPSTVSDFSLQIFEGERYFDELSNRILGPVDPKARKLWNALALAEGYSTGSADGSSNITFHDSSESAARVIVTTCHCKKAFTLTIRLSNDCKTPKSDACKNRDKANTDELRQADKFPIQAIHTATSLWSKITGGRSAHSPTRSEGLVVIAGATKSGKSELMKAMVNEYVASQATRDKRLHLVTCEDPIEQWLPNKKPGDIRDAKQTSEFFLTNDINYTPRLLGRDVVSVAQALKDAKRQTPACYVVGEVRRAEDWQEIVDFASTGHLIVVTTHAASVREAILRVFKALNVTRAQERRMIANALLAVIHAELIPVDYTTRRDKQNSLHVTSQAQLPMMWFRTPSSVNQLTVDGLSSVLPNSDFCLSREQMLLHMIAEKKIGAVDIEIKSASKTVPVSLETNIKILETAARRRDIEELRKP